MPRPVDDPITAMRLRELSAEDWASLLAGPPERAARWVEAAARHGSRAALVLRGQMLLDGTGVPRDLEAAYRSFARAAALGSPDGINMVGRCHELGWGVPVDHAAALAWYRRAAAKGLAWGQYNLASLLLYGEGVAWDGAEALAWYGRAADQGHAGAMGMIGRFHEEGWVVPADRDLALAWYERGGRAGDPWARFNAARLLADAGRLGEAVPLLRLAIGNGTHNFLRSVGPALAAHPDPTIRALADEALARCQAGDALAFQRAVRCEPSREPQGAPKTGSPTRRGLPGLARRLLRQASAAGVAASRRAPFPTA